MHKKTKYNVLGICAAIAVAVLLAGLLIPIRLEVDIKPEKLYNYETLERDDITVYASPLFRRGKQVTDFSFEKVSTDEHDSITVQEAILYKRIHIRNVKLDKLEAVYLESAHDGDPFDKDKIKVTAYYKNGSSEPITSYEIIGEEKTLGVNSDIVIKTKLGSAKLEIPFESFTELSASYTSTAYEGDKFNEEFVSVSMKYEDGTAIPIDNFTYEGKSVIRGKTEYTIYTAYGTTTLTVDPVSVDYATTTGKYAAGSTFDGPIILTYEDDTEKELDVSDVTFESSPVLEYGVNAIPFKWKKIDYTLYVAASAATRVSEAQNSLQDEIAASAYNELSSNLFMTITKVGEDKPFYLTHVVLANPNQIRVESASGEYGKSLEAPSSAAKRTKWTVGINGSFFDSATAVPLGASCMIRDGKMVNSGETTGYEVCLTKEGAIFSPPAGVTASGLIDIGVKDILISTDPLLIQDGNVYSEGSTAIGGNYARTAVGMVKPGEYYFLTSDTGLTYAEMQSVFQGLQCQYARSLDGGSSVALYYKEQAVNETENRRVADFLCVYDTTDSSQDTDGAEGAINVEDE